jgi:MFS family permease
MSTETPAAASAGSGWGHVLQTASALAAGMGVGRFVYTPILPEMTAHAGLSAAAGANLATGNYLGYLVGAVAGITSPALLRSRAVLRATLVTLTVSLAAMPATHSVTGWLLLRFLAGLASALIFVIAVNSLLTHLRHHPAHLPGWAFGGVGAGIALSGLLVLALHPLASWRADWWAAAGLAALLSAASWNLQPEMPPSATQSTETPARTHRWFTTLFVSYTLEGIGYIVAGTFLVAAIAQNAPGWAGSAAWVLVGLAAVPSAAAWAALGRRRSRPNLLLAALGIQAVGIALPAMLGGVVAALVSAVLFGATFLGVTTLALALGAHLQFPRSVALLTAGYSVGQILGPLLVAPSLRHGYHQAMLVAAAVIALSALAAAALRIRFPHHLGQTS